MESKRHRSGNFKEGAVFDAHHWSAGSIKSFVGFRLNTGVTLIHVMPNVSFGLCVFFVSLFGL